MKFKEVKVAERDTRQAEYDALTPKQKLDQLDLVLGKGVGAKKQRAKLEKQLAETKPTKVKSK